MAHAHGEASLVYHYRPSPLADGTSSYTPASQEMAWSGPHQSISSSSSASQSSSSSQHNPLASNRADRGYELEASPSFSQPRFPSEEYGRPRYNSHMDAGFTARFHAAGSSLQDSYEDPRAALTRYATLRPEEGHTSYDSQPSNAHSHHSPTPSHFCGVFRTERNPVGNPRYTPYRQPPTGQSDSVSLAGSDYAHGSPATSNAETESNTSGSHQYGAPAPLRTSMSVTVPRQKHRKQRLYAIDRQRICLHARDHPKDRQEDIASYFNVERSTVSKILKAKDRWLNAATSEPRPMMAKERTAKFGELESKMLAWVLEQHHARTTFTDATIRAKALELALDCPDTKDKFKASPGWIENFKARAGIRKGRYYGDGTYAQRRDSKEENIAEDAAALGPRQTLDLPKSYRGHTPGGEILLTATGTHETDSIGGGGGHAAGPEGPEGESWPDAENAHRVALDTGLPMHSTIMSPSILDPASTDHTTSYVEHHGTQYIVAEPMETKPIHSGYSVQESMDIGSQYSEDPQNDDLEAAVLTVVRLCRKEAFKKHAELTPQDDDCLNNIFRGLKTYLRGLPYRRV